MSVGSKPATVERNFAQENTRDFGRPTPRAPSQYARHTVCIATPGQEKASIIDQRKEHAMLPIRTILHPTDFSENSGYAFQFACALARDYGAKLVVLHVYPTPVLFGDSMSALPLDVPRDELLKMLNEIKPDDPAIAIERVLVVGEAAYEIRLAAEAHHANLIVMGTHGRGGLSRLVMGSVAEDVSRNANCPVLTVRSKAGVIREEPAKTAQTEAAAVG
jgi:nucleotide-binding universal stress UspA family protein